MEIDKFIQFTLSIYVVFLIVDIAKAYKDSVYYKLKYMVTLPHQKFLRLFLNNQKWTIVGVVFTMIWLQIIMFFIG